MANCRLTIADSWLIVSQLLVVCMLRGTVLHNYIYLEVRGKYLLYIAINFRLFSLSITLLAESLWSFLDKSGKRKRLCRHLQIPLICWSFCDLDESDKFLTINQFSLCTHAYSGVLLTLSALMLYNKTNSCRFNFMQEFWKNYRSNIQF